MNNWFHAQLMIAVCDVSIFVDSLNWRFQLGHVYGVSGGNARSTCTCYRKSFQLNLGQSL
jgi:hypothetical protein